MAQKDVGLSALPGIMGGGRSGHCRTLPSPLPAELPLLLLLMEEVPPSPLAPRPCLRFCSCCFRAALSPRPAIAAECPPLLSPAAAAASATWCAAVITRPASSSAITLCPTSARSTAPRA